MDLETAQTTTIAKLPILKQENGNSFKPATQTITNADSTSTLLILGPVTTEEKYKGAKTLFAAIQTRFGGNKAIKKIQKTLLKQMLQKIISQLAILGENISQEDLNLKFLRSLPSEWNTHVVVRRNKPNLDTMSFDVLYSNFKIFEQEVKRTTSSSSSLSSQNMAFVSSPSSTNEANTAYGVSTSNTQVSPASTQVSTAGTQVSTSNLSDATIYAFFANQPNGSQLVYEDLEQIHKDDLEKMDLKWQLALLSMKTRRGPKNQDSRNKNQDNSRKTLNVEETSSKAMVAIDGAGLFSSPNLDLSYSGLEGFQQLEFEGYGPNPSKSVSEDIYNEVRQSLDAPLVEELVPDDKLEKKIADCNYHQMERVVSGNNYTMVNYNYFAKKAHPSAHRNIVPRAVLMKTGLRSLNTVRPINTAHPKTTVYSDRPMSRFSKSAQSTVKRPYKIRTTLTNKNFSQKVNTAKGKFYTARPKAVNTARRNLAVVNVVRANQVNAVKASACHPQKEDQGYVDSGCSRHMTGKMSYLSDFKEFDGGYITFGEGAKGGKVTGKGTLKTGKATQSLLFTSVFFLATKDETSGILKSFITEVENIVDKKVKIIRCDNGTEFKNRVVSKFDLKSDEGFFVGYSMNSKAFRVYNIRTRKGEENLHIRFLEDKPITAGDGPNWLSDIDVLTKLMNYVLVVAGTNSNDFLGTEESIGASHSSKETGSSQDYILMPLWKDGSLFDSSLKNASNDEPQPSVMPERRMMKVINTEPDMFSLGDNATLEATHVDFVGDEIEVEMSNITTTYPVPSTPNTRIHKDHSLDHVIGDV
ncbi:ribonuclease H-like domain-containing protein [Tanacetum coccineum]